LIEKYPSSAKGLYERLEQKLDQMQKADEDLNVEEALGNVRLELIRFVVH